MEKLVDLVLHPVRMRIIMAFSGREMTAQQIAEVLGDVPPATLYRHLNRLSEAGILTVTAERRVRGTLEKVYALGRQRAHLGVEEFTALSREEHLRYFTTFVATLLDDFSRYVNNAPTIDPLADGVGYQKLPLNLSDEEFAAVAQGINAAIIPYLNNPPAPERKRRIFATVVMPDLENNPPQEKPAPETSTNKDLTNLENE